MRIFEINTRDDQWVTKAAELIANDCKPYLQQVSGNITNSLYRGVSPGRINNGNLIRSQCPTNRPPMSTPKRFHYMIDEWFLSQFGVSYRSSAIFTTGNYMQATEYGTVYAAFPIGNFSFCYSPKVEDLFDHWPPLRVDAVDKMSDEYIREYVTEKLARFQYTDKNLPAAIESQCEVMIHCDEYYLIKLGSRFRYILTLLQHELEVR